MGCSCCGLTAWAGKRLGPLPPGPELGRHQACPPALGGVQPSPVSPAPRRWGWGGHEVRYPGTAPGAPSEPASSTASSSELRTRFIHAGTHGASDGIRGARGGTWTPLSTGASETRWAHGEIGPGFAAEEGDRGSGAKPEGWQPGSPAPVPSERPGQEEVPEAALTEAGSAFQLWPPST